MSLCRFARLSYRCLQSRVLFPANSGRFYQAYSNGTLHSVRHVIVSSPPSNLKLARFFSSLPTHVVVKLPNLSPTMETGTVVSWAKNVGDKVGEGDLLAEIETDKATMAMEASDEGYVAKILIPAGTKNVPVGYPLVVIVEDTSSIEAFNDFQPSLDATPPSAAAPKQTSAPAPPPPPPPPPTVSPPPPAAAPPPPAPPPPCKAPVKSPAGSGSRLFISPLARRVATERGIDLSQLSGTGSGVDGCFVLADLDNIVVNAPTTTYADIPVTGMRSTIAKRLLESKRTIPHYYLTMEVDLDATMGVRESLNASLAKQAVPGEKPFKISINDILIKAMALANKAVPDCNSSFMGDFIRRYDSVDVCVAVATPSGLITPIIFNADTKGLFTISQEVRALAERAKTNKLKPEEFQGGTITISNLGMFGVTSFSAIINPPQACILSVGGSEQVLVPDKEKGYKTVNKVAVTLCCDHRVVDGAVGAKWLQEFKSLVETPARMLL